MSFFKGIDNFFREIAFVKIPRKPIYCTKAQTRLFCGEKVIGAQFVVIFREINC